MTDPIGKKPILFNVEKGEAASIEETAIDPVLKADPLPDKNWQCSGMIQSVAPCSFGNDSFCFGRCIK